MTEPEAAMMSQLKEMKDQMLASDTKVEELRHNQARELSQIRSTGGGRRQKWLWNSHNTDRVYKNIYESSILRHIDEDCKKWVKHFGMLNCDSIWCPKLDPVIQGIVLNDTIKVNGYTLILPPPILVGCNISAIMEKLTPKLSVLVAQTALSDGQCSPAYGP